MQTLVGPVRRTAQSALQNITPTRLRLLLVLNCLWAVLFCVVAVGTVKQHEHAVRTVGVDAAPSIIAAQEIKIGVERMDSDLAKELLYAPRLPEARQTVQDFEDRLASVNKQLVEAAKNITYGSAEQVPVENIQIALSRYLMQVQAVRDMHNSVAGAEALSLYQVALHTLEGSLLPNAEALNKANADVLESIYAREKAATNLLRGFVLVMGLGLIGLLLYTQIYLGIRFRRRLNIPLLVATVCVVLFLQHLTRALADNSHFLKVAKEDSYNSVFALLDARAHSYCADAAQARYLLDRTQADIHQKRFLDEVTKVASFDKGHDFAETVSKVQQQLDNNERLNLPGFSGALADELNNARFPGEAQAALEALQAFMDYCAADARMRQMEKSGDLSAAVRMCLGYAPNECRFPLSKFDDAVGRTLKINQDHLRLAVDEAFQDLVGLVAGAQLVSALVVVCAVLGLIPRVDEYVHCGPKSGE